MIDINRHNYEAWFLDYMDGNLNEQQVADLLLFLENNPDLKKEFDMDLSEVTLESETVKYTFKEDIKRATAINSSNVDDFMIAETEGILDENGKLELNEYVAANNLEKDRKLYSLVYLVKTNAHIFPNKEKLKRGGFLIPLYIRYAAAAAILLFMAFALYLNRNPSASGNEFAIKNEKVEPQLDQLKPSKEKPTVNTIPNIALVDGTQVDHNNEVLRNNENEAKKTEDPSSFQVALTNNFQPKNNSSSTNQIKALKSKSTYATPINAFAIQNDNPTLNGLNPIAIAPFKNLDENTLADNSTSNKAKNYGKEPLTVWQYAGLKIKENILGHENPEDAKIRENDLANVVATGINKLTNNEIIAFEDNSKNGQIQYGVQIGKIGFTRTTNK